MQPSSPKRSQPEPENKCPDCLYMKLEGIPVQPDSLEYFDFWQTSNQTQQIDLHLTISFDEQWQSLKGGRIKFGLKGGELRLKLENSEISDQSRNLAGTFELYLPKPKQESHPANLEKKSMEVRTRAFNPALNGSNPPAQTSVNTEQLPTNICHITTKLSEEHPAWVLEEETGLVLRGSLRKTKLATLNVTALPCRVEATFEISQQDLHLTDAEGLWPPDISRNKRAVLDRLIVQRLLEPKFKPYLSKAVLYYD